ncbi:MAG: MutS-related protein [Anaerolineales bacterium]
MPPALSLLWPPTLARAFTSRRSRWLDGATTNLGLADLTRALSGGFAHHNFIEGLLLDLCSHADVIRYRQDVLDDLLRLPDLTAQFQTLLPELEELQAPSFRSTQESIFYQTVWRLAELETFVTVVKALREALLAAEGALRSEGLRALLSRLDDIREDATFLHLEAQLPDLAQRLRGVQSLSVGVNLDSRLRPVAATLLGVHDKPFKGESLLARLFGRDEETGLAPLHAVPNRGADSLRGYRAEMESPFLSPLFRDLESVLADIAKPIAETLRHYHAVNGQGLVELAPELAFYLGGVKLIRTMRAAGLPMCRPEIAPMDERAAAISGLYNINLALRIMGSAPEPRSTMVPSDLRFGPEGRLAVLTGPNRGGKTTYTQAVGLVHVLFQAGLHVPGESARLSPVDAVYVHFTRAEQLHLDAGRLGEEAKRVAEIFKQATRHSLVLFNETFASTAPSEGLYLARDVLRGFRRVGARGIFATHFHELAEQVQTMNAETPGESVVISLIAEAIPAANGADAQRTFRIRPGPPLGTSYAREIAMRYGISFEQIEQTLRQRGLND